MSIRDDILAGLRAAEAGSIGDETPEELLARYDALKCTEEDLIEARPYRRLAEAIGATMTDPDQWDGDDDEPTILIRYVEWLAAGSPMEDGWPVRFEAGESRG